MRCMDLQIITQERADPDWANTSIKPFQCTSRRKKALTLGRRKEKFRQRNWGLNPGPLACPIAAKESCGSHLFGVGPGEADETAIMQELTKAVTFFVLRPILVKFHIRTWLIESFATTYGLWCADEKLHFTPVHTLRRLKLEEGAVSTTAEGRRVSSG